jgi:hypothetical protein
MAKARSIDDSFELIGAFWPYGSPEQRFTGTLAVNKGKVTLVSSPEYSSIDNLSEAVGAGLATMKNPTAKRIEGFSGFTEDGDCSLLDNMFLDTGGLINFPTLQRLDNQEYRVSAAVMGIQLESLDAKSIDSAAFYFTKIHRWLPATWTVKFEGDQRTFVAPSKAAEVLKFKNTFLGAEVTCQVFAGGQMKARKQAKITSVARIKVTPDHRQSLEWFNEVAIRLENFFVLCLGTSLSLREFQLFCGETDGYVVQRVRRRDEKINFRAWIESPKDVIAGALNKWLSVPEDKRPVEKTLLGVLRKSSVVVETEFLSLAQALEGFSRIRVSKQMKFAARISETYDMLTSGFALKLLGPKDDFVGKIVATRNFFTHLGSAAKKDVVQDAGGLFDLNQKLYAFLRCVMLLELGVPEANLQSPILYQATRWKVY